MSEFEREQTAFRAGLANHVDEAPLEFPTVRTRRRRSRWAVIAAAAAVAAIVSSATLFLGTGDDRPDQPTTPSPEPESGWRWVGLRNVEVQAPVSWELAYEAVRPDCIFDPADRDSPWARDVPDAPYVTVGTPSRAVPSVGCFRSPKPGDPDPAFGQLPFSLWQPYVKLVSARPDLDYPDRADGEWAHEGWRLTRSTVSGVQITVLAPPERPALGEQVLDSARIVQHTSLGCDPASRVQGLRFTRSETSVPTADAVAAVAICEYSRHSRNAVSSSGLEGSRRLEGQAATDLVEAILVAPREDGPNQPENCSEEYYGDRAIALRFFATTDETKAPIGEAFVYYDWCRSNGIFDVEGARRLTEANCSPLFAKPPISIWGGQRYVVEVCGPLGLR